MTRFADSAHFEVAPTWTPAVRSRSQGAPLPQADGPDEWTSQKLAPATRRNVIAALIAIGSIGAVTIAVLPFARELGPALAGFVPAYQAAVFLLYALSSIHLFNHAARTGFLPLLHVAAGCLFSALILLTQMFSFPIWGPSQLIGQSSETTIWLWTYWHIGPAMFTISYVAARSRGRRQSSPRMVATAVAVPLALAGAATAASTWALPWLPTLSLGDNYDAVVTSGVGPAVLATTLAALALLIWRTRCATLIELCLAAALALLALDDLPTLAGGARLSVGWYVGRMEAAVSAAILLGFYLVDISQRTATMAEAAVQLSHEREHLRAAYRNQAEANATLALLARQDSLTGLANRRRLEHALELEWRQAKREQTPLTLLMIDVDHFKLYNDTLGHPAGDACLQSIANLLQDAAQRPGDLAARYGGEEFAVLLAGSDARGGVDTARKFQELLAAAAIPHPRSEKGVVTVSIGVGSIIPVGDANNYAVLIEFADRALYDAKRAGRNRVLQCSENAWV